MPNVFCHQKAKLNNMSTYSNSFTEWKMAKSGKPEYVYLRLIYLWVLLGFYIWHLKSF